MNFWDRVKKNIKKSTTHSEFIKSNPLVTGLYITKEHRQKVMRKAEKTIEKVNPNIAKKLKKINEKKENLEQTVENFIDANNPVNIFIRAISKTEDLQSGDHLIVQRVGYTHHGLYIGDQKVIHYLNEEGVVVTSLKDFAKNSNIHSKNSPVHYTRSQILSRAYSRVGEKGYNLFQNNCENFVNWCRNGR